MARRLAGNIRSRAHVCPTVAQLEIDQPKWKLSTMAWNDSQKRLREGLNNGALVSVFSGGNFSTKTYGSVAIALRACLGMETWCPTPANVALCGLSMSQSREAFQSYLVDLLQRPGAGDLVHNSTKREGLYSVIEFCNGSRLSILTVGQGADLHQGARRSLIVYDEEPDYSVYEEGLFRFRSGMKSRMIFSMTPTHGRSWVWDQLVDSDNANTHKVTASTFENCAFLCTLCERLDEFAVDQEANEPYCECEVPVWTIPCCPACGKDRAWWDAQLEILGLVREPEQGVQEAKDWIQLQVAATLDVKVEHEGGACGRCWTFGVLPRVSADEVRDRLKRVRDPKRVAMRFCGWWEELDGQSCVTRGQMKALRAYAKEPIKVEGPVRIFEPAKKFHSYVLGVDMAQGTGGDEIAMQMADAATGHQVAMWAANDIRWTISMPDCVDLAREYHNAIICPENASTGHGLIEYLKEQPGLRLYHYRSPDRHIRSVLSDKVGFNPQGRNADRIRQNFIHAIENGLEEQPDGSWVVQPGNKNACYLVDRRTIEQLGDWYYDTEKDGAIASPNRDACDDRVDAMALAWECRCHPDTNTTVRAPQLVTPQDHRWSALKRQFRRWPGSNR